MACNPFPNEVWLEILSYLDYVALKKCQRVSKMFKALTEHPALDANLFRAGKSAVAEYKPGLQYELHPALTGYGCFDLNYQFLGLKDFRLCGDATKLHQVAPTVSAEWATVPPLSSICIGVDLEGSFLVDVVETDPFKPYLETNHGVTVRDVLDAVLDRCIQAGYSEQIGNIPTTWDMYVDLEKSNPPPGVPLGVIFHGYYVDQSKQGGSEQGSEYMPGDSGEDFADNDEDEYDD